MPRINVEIIPGDGGQPRVPARAIAGNITGLAETGTDRVAVNEGANPLCGRRAWEARGLIAEHDRNQTVWSPVARIAAKATASRLWAEGRP